MMLEREEIQSVKSIAEYLISAQQPVPETQLMKFAFSSDDLPHEQYELYRKHFLLYNRLYIIQEEYGKNSFYLHLHPLRIRLIETVGGCSYYYPDEGGFCGQLPRLNAYCEHHHMRSDIRFPVYDCMRAFYLDIKNIEWPEFEKIEHVRKGIMLYSAGITDIKKALQFMGFSCDFPGGYRIRKRYRELARKYHPDASGNIDNMKQLNEYYELLKKVFVV